MEKTDASFIPQKGNYRDLIAYKKAECIYDITYYFAHKFFEKIGLSIRWCRLPARESRI